MSARYAGLMLVLMFKALPGCSPSDCSPCMEDGTEIGPDAAEPLDFPDVDLLDLPEEEEEEEEDLAHDVPGDDGERDVDCRTTRPLDWLRIMSFNIKSARESDIEAIALAIREEAPDIVGLQEVDVDTNRSGGIDQPHRLSQLTGMASLFRTALDYDDGRYGLALLSRFPIITSDKVMLTSGSEQRILVIVDILGPGGDTLHVAVTHLGLDAAEREAQADEIAQELSPLGSVILTGDFNVEPGSAVYDVLTGFLADAWPGAGSGHGYTFPADTPTRRIDWILVSGSLPSPSCAWVPDTQASDHRPVVVTLARE